MTNRWYKKIFRGVSLIFVIFILLDGYIWFLISRDRNGSVVSPVFYFLDVGQGDSELITVPDGRGGNFNMLIDGGPDSRVLDSLRQSLPADDRYIDLLLMTHPQLDHFGGFIDVIKNYDIGAFLSTGRKGTSAAYATLQSIINGREVPVVTLRAGDRIQYQGVIIDILSPDESMLASDALNDTSLVLRVDDGHGNRALFTGDIGENIETALIQKGLDIRAALLKVPHHGSRFSSSRSFLEAVRPLAAVIEVGKNSYGHPTKSAMERIENTGAALYETLTEGTVRVEFRGEKLYVYNQ